MSYTMPEEITFEVTQEHIDKGVPNDAGNCPCWHALHDSKWEVDGVDYKEIVIYDDFGSSHLYCLSPEATSWLHGYDLGVEPCSPATFTIQLEDPDRRL